MRTILENVGKTYKEGGYKTLQYSININLNLCMIARGYEQQAYSVWHHQTISLSKIQSSDNLAARAATPACYDVMCQMLG